jgi:hypothetical protein
MRRIVAAANASIIDFLGLEVKVGSLERQQNPVDNL